MTEDMDDIDRAWMASALPEGAVPQGFVSVVAWFDTEGQQRFKVVNLIDADVSGVLGLLELAKCDTIARTEGLWFGMPEEGD